MRTNLGAEGYPASMRQTRLVFMAAAGVLALCGIVVIGSLMDYVSHPETANVHVPPVVGTPAPAPPVDETPVPLPPPTAAVPTDLPQATPPRSPVAQRSPGRLSLSQLLQEIQAQRRRRPPPG